VSKLSNRIFIGVATATLAAAAVAQPVSSSPVVYYKTTSAGYPVHVVQVDLNREGVRLGVATAQSGLGTLDNWSRMIDRTRPTAAVTGTYFCTSSLLPIGSIVTSGQRVYTGTIGTAFTYEPTRGARIVSTKPGAVYPWSGRETVLQAGPRLLTSGHRTLWPEAEGFRDPAVFAKRKRTVLGVNAHNKLMLVAIERPVLLREAAAVMRGLGAMDAMCLDGGTSTGLYFRGKSHVVPGRSLTNLLVVYDNPDRFDAFSHMLNPF
jgi:exopolysaccharide biosynthesis protein